jgi:hypothetical protein
MKFRMSIIVPLACVLFSGVVARGQEQQPPPRPEAGQQQQPPPDRPARGAQRWDRNPPGPPADGPGGMGAGRMPGPPPGQPGNVPPEVARLRAYLELVDQFTRLSKDADAAGVAAVLTAGDILKPRGQDAVIDYYQKMLAKTPSAAVQRAIRIALSQAYRETGQQEKAMEQLEALMTGNAPSAAATSRGEEKK